MIVLVNLLTASRIIGVIPFIWLVRNGYGAAAFGLFILLMLTDAFDGYLARKYGCVTDWGKFFDPTADKILIMTAIFAFLRSRFVFDFLVLGFYECLLLVTAVLACLFPKKIGRALGANSVGKAKVWAEAALALFLFADAEIVQVGDGMIQALFLLAILLAFGSLVGHWKPVWHSAWQKNTGSP